MKRFLTVSVIVLIASFPARADITIGFAGPLTGENASFGEQMKRGAERAVADINAQGGVNGEKLVPRYADDACDPKQAVTVANQMASAGIKFVVGHFCSGASIPASKVYNEEGVFMISPASTNPALTDAGFSDVFRVCGRDDEQGSAIAKYILKHFRDKKVAVLNNQSAWGLGIAQELKKDLNEGGMKETMFEAYTPSTRDYSALVTRLKQAGIDVAFVGGYYTDVGLVVRQAKEQGANIQFIGGDAIVTDQFWAVTGPTGEGVLMSFSPDPRKLPDAKPVLDAFRKNGYEPEGYTLYTYAAFQVIAEGLKRSGAADPSKTAITLRQTPVKTVLGTIGFDTKGDVTGYNYVLYRWHDGKYVEIEDK